MKKILIAGLISTTFLLAFGKVHSLKGTWNYVGGSTNGRPEDAPADYQLQRKYTENSFEAFLIEEGSKPEKYQAGTYTLTTDSCLETETYNAQSNKLTGVTLHYQYYIKHDTLFLQGRLPGGTSVLEYWKKIR